MQKGVSAGRQLLMQPLHQRGVHRPAGHTHRAVDDAQILRPGRKEHILVALAGVALFGGDEPGSHLGPGRAQPGAPGHLGPGGHAPGAEQGNGPAELLLKGAQGGQHLGDELGEGRTAPGQQVGLLKAQVAAGLAALQHHKVRHAAVALCPGAADELCCPGAGHDGGQQRLKALGQGGQLQRQARPADNGIGPGFQRGAHTVGILAGGHHGIYRHKAGPGGQPFGPLYLPAQGAQVGLLGVGGKVRLVPAGVGGAQGAHGPFGGHGTGQPAHGDAHAHAALNQGKGQLPVSQLHAFASSAARVALQPLSRSSKMARRGRISWSIPAT